MSDSTSDAAMAAAHQSLALLWRGRGRRRSRRRLRRGYDPIGETSAQIEAHPADD